MVFGDSFAFGHGADDRLFFGASHGTSTGIKGVGCNGYNTVQAVLWMKQYESRLRGRLAVLWIYYGNDLEDNLLPCSRDGYRMPFVRERSPGQWEFCREHVTREPWPFDVRTPQATLPALCCDTRLARRAFEAARFLIDEAHLSSQRAGAGFVVMGVPDPRQLRARGRRGLHRAAPDAGSFDPLYADAQLGNLCAAAGVRFVALSDYLTGREYLWDDCHWTSRGHRRVAKLLDEIHGEMLGSDQKVFDRGGLAASPLVSDMREAGARRGRPETVSPSRIG